MEIIEIHNGNDVVATSIHLSEEERQNVEKTISIMKGFETIAKDPRDVFEFKYAQKLLKMVLSLDAVEDLTEGIDAILFDSDLVDDIGILSPEMEDNEITAIAEIAQAISAELWNNSSKKKKKSFPKIEEKYKQLSIDFPDGNPKRGE